MSAKHSHIFQQMECEFDAVVVHVWVGGKEGGCGGRRGSREASCLYGDIISLTKAGVTESTFQKDARGPEKITLCR